MKWFLHARVQCEAKTAFVRFCKHTEVRSKAGRRGIEKKLQRSFRERTQTPEQRRNNHLQEIYSYSNICAKAAELKWPCLFAGLLTLARWQSDLISSCHTCHKNNHFQTVVSSWSVCLFSHGTACSTLGEKNPFNLVEVLRVNFLPTTGNAELHWREEWSQEDWGFSDFTTSAVKSFK